MVIRPEFDTSERNMEPIRPNDPNRMDELTQNDRGDVQKAYRVEELTTSGWELLNEKAQQLPKDQAKIWLEWGLNEGISPQSLRAIPEKPVRENHFVHNCTNCAYDSFCFCSRYGRLLSCFSNCSWSDIWRSYLAS